MIYTITLNPALDYDIYVDNFKTNELNLSKKNKFRVGGKGINVSIMLKNLGIDSIALGFIGGFTGDYILSELNRLNISNDLIKINDVTRINIKLNDNNKETEIAGISPKIDEKSLDKLYEKIKLLNSNDLLILSGSINKNLDICLYKEISKNTKAKVILDTRGENLLDNIYNNLLIKPNIKELEIMFGKKIESEDELFNLCKLLFNKGVENIIVSLGGDGAYLVTKDSMYKASVPKGEVINTIGAGDSMVAGFIYSYVNNMNLEETLKMSISCGSATAYSYEIGKKEMVFNLYKSVKIEKIK